eukprot:1876093-Pleurochrysis_carterae.AAC.5
MSIALHPQSVASERVDCGRRQAPKFCEAGGRLQSSARLSARSTQTCGSDDAFELLAPQRELEFAR